MKRVLVIDDNMEICFIMSAYLKKAGYEADEVSSGNAAMKIIAQKKYDVVFCDYRLPDIEGLELLKKIKKESPTSAVIMMTAYADVRIAVLCLKQGASDYLTKPIHHQEVLHLIEQVTSEPKIQPKKKSKKKSGDDGFVWGNSPATKRLIKNIELVAPTDITILITGETGTGKEYVARSIHNGSARSSEPFIAVDCGAISEELAGSELFGHTKGSFTGAVNDKTGQFELANGGTLFLDEIGNLSYENQIKLLRVLQEKSIRKVGGEKDIPVDVRLIVATNENLQTAIANGQFREDIYHRLNEFSMELEPLRYRKEDIPTYIEHFVEQSNSELGKSIEGFDDITQQKLVDYYWHGNLRELRNVIKRSILLSTGKKASMETIPEEIQFGVQDSVGSAAQADHIITDLKSVVEKAEREAIIKVLKQTGHNKTKTADLLKVDRKTLYNKMNQYGLM